MKKLLLTVTVLLLTGCHLEQPYLYPLNVKIKENIPCFSLPNVIYFRNMYIRGISVYKKSAGLWADVWHSPETNRDESISGDECISYQATGWQPATYSVLIGGKGRDSGKLFRFEVTFTLVRDKTGRADI